jgi:hypothetical protein
MGDATCTHKWLLQKERVCLRWTTFIHPQQPVRGIGQPTDFVDYQEVNEGLSKRLKLL